MAFCPACNKPIPAMARVCEHCGYDFPSKVEVDHPSWMYGRFATVALVCGQIAAFIGVVASLGMFIYLCYQHFWLPAVQGLFGAITMFALAIVFARAQRSQI